MEAVRPYIDRLQQIVDRMPQGSYIDVKTGEIKMEETKQKTNNDLVDTYIHQVIDQQNQIGELQKTIKELRSKIEENKRDLILKDIERIFDEFMHIPDGTTTLKNDIVDYILERENK